MAVTAWLPTVPPRPAPDLMTADEAVIYLRLDAGEDGGLTSLTRYRTSGRLKGVKIGRSVKYRLADFRRFVQEMADG